MFSGLPAQRPRIEVLGERANEGALNAEERSEYEALASCILSRTTDLTTGRE